MDMTQSSDILRVHATKNRTKVLGPGERFALWLQGCEKNCAGCMSLSSQNPNDGKLIPVDNLVNKILAEKKIEGITISGGEPFLQFKALCNLLQQLREKSSLGVIIYSGYYLAELHEMNIPEIEEIIIKYADIIIDGPYIDELNDGKSLRGSSNQTVHFLSSRYKENASSVYNQDDRKWEIVYDSEEEFLCGIPDKTGYQIWRGISMPKQTGNEKGNGDLIV